MPDSISAKCLSCGHGISVPATLGGKPTRCPKCSSTIAIPAPVHPPDNIVPDTEFPEVACEDEILEGKFIDDYGGGKGTGEVRRRAGMTPRRGSAKARPDGRNPRPLEKSNTALWVGIGIGVVAIVILGIVLASGNGKGKAPKLPVKEDVPPPKAKISEADSFLAARCLQYVEAVNGGNTEVVIKFYTYDERFKTLKAINEMVDAKLTYEGVSVTSVSAATGVTTFTYGGSREKTLNWKEVDGVWMIADKPAP
jgi:DNA-directed RNA polymerase subunit RPC12/RpoP